MSIVGMENNSAVLDGSGGGDVVRGGEGDGGRVGKGDAKKAWVFEPERGGEGREERETSENVDDDEGVRKERRE